jgi:two-component system response regulator AtoC
VCRIQHVKSTPSFLLLVKADPLPDSLLKAFAAERIRVELASTRAAFDLAMVKRLVDVVMYDADFAAFPLAEIKTVIAAQAADLPLVVMAGPATVGVAIDAVKAGAYGYVMKPLVAEDVLLVLQSAYMTALSAAARPPVTPVGDGAAGAEPLGDSPAIRAVSDLVVRAAQSQATVLLGGETGTGKGLIARRIHDLSPRRAGAFVKVQGGALPDALFESELFGYEKGAFTGAAVRKPGRVEMAEKGTLFLDEIGDVSLAVQVKLLRLLQDREYERLGDTKTRPADVRFVAATHRDLPALVAKGDFREDLYYRLNVVQIILPSLRERPEDIPGLARHFAATAARTNGVPLTELTDDAITVLGQQRWPGNVRQLQNLIERLVVLSDSPVVTADDVRRAIGENPFDTGAPQAPSTLAVGEQGAQAVSAIDLKGAVSKAERRQIDKALLKAKGNRDLAARLLGVSRRTLYYKLRVYGME